MNLISKQMDISQRIIDMPAKTGIRGYGKGRAKLGSKKRKARRKKQ